MLNAAPVTESDQPAYYAYYGKPDTQDLAVAKPKDLSPNGADRSPSENGRAARHRRIRSGTRS